MVFATHNEPLLASGRKPKCPLPPKGCMHRLMRAHSISFAINASKRTGSCPFYNLKNRGETSKDFKGTTPKKCHFFKPRTKQTSTHPHTCSETSYRITDVECIVRAKTLQLSLTGTVWMIRNEKLCEGKLSTSLLEGFTSSDAAQSDCENRANEKMKPDCLETAWWFLG